MSSSPRTPCGQSFKDLTIGKAENGKVAFEKVRDEEWDLVLMDIHMPEMSGLEATAAIRKLPDADKAKHAHRRHDRQRAARRRPTITCATAWTVSSPSLSKPTSSRTRFPAAAQGPQEGKPIRSSPVLPPLRILLAEDNPFNVIVAEDTLRTELDNVTIGKAENGRSPLEMVREGEWDIVLMDIAMPEMTGIEATLAIRKLEDAREGRHHHHRHDRQRPQGRHRPLPEEGHGRVRPQALQGGAAAFEIERAHLSKKK